MNLRVLVKSVIAHSGIPMSFRIRALNDLLDLGKWIQQNPPRFHASDRFELYRYLNTEVLRDGPIDYLEFGVYRGESIRTWAALNRNPQSRFIGFDSFEGLPEDWRMVTATMKKGTFSTDGQIPDVGDSRVGFEKGWFHQSLPKFLRNFQPCRPMVLHLDADLYSSTLFVLASLNPFVAPGTILVFDEFSSASNEFRALVDYCRSFNRKVRTLASTHDFHTQLACEIT